MRFYLKFSVIAMLLVAAISINAMLEYNTVLNNRDGSSYEARIYFMNKYGYFQNVPNWSHGYGYTAFLFYPPLFAFFSIPFYALTGSVMSSYAAIMIFFSVAAVAMIYVLRKMVGMDKLQALFLGLFFFFNPFAISRFYRTGRVSEQLGWLFFIAAFFLIIYYKDRRLDRKFFYIYGVVSALALLSHTANFIMITVILAGLFLYKHKREWVPIIGSFLLGIILSSFWWVPFVVSEGDYLLSTDQFMNKTVIESFPKNILFQSTAILIPIAALSLIFLYYRKEGGIRNGLFLSMVSLPIALFLFRLTPYIPIVNRMGTGFFFVYPLFVGAYYMLKTGYDRRTEKIMGACVLAVSVGMVLFTGVFYSTMHEVDFRTCPEYNMSKTFFPEIDGTYEILPTSGYCRHTAIAYATIFHDLNTTGNWHPEAAPKALEERRLSLFSAVEDANCTGIKAITEYLSIEYLIGKDDDCVSMESCGLQEAGKEGSFCMFRV
ncbi:MAG: hypothetical protein DRO99_01720 [Candidatus Aenigmatarchaeota archaeon]|nr:MAG: hypothetical protein DRO99_01720 [Candidatus Aenigmarchaeota archaeon]